MSFERIDGELFCGDLEEWIQDKRGRWTTTKLRANADKVGEYFREAV